MAETGLIYAAQSFATDGSPILNLRRKPNILDLDYEEVKKWGVIATGNRPDFVWFRGDLYLIGGYSRVLVRDRSEGRWWPAGVRQPESAVSVVEGSGSGGSPGECLAYQTFLHKQGPRLLAESNPSKITELPGQTGKGYDWTLQTSGAEARTTHVRGYRSMNGGYYRLAFEVPYGTSAYTENVKTNQLLQTGPSGHYLPPFGLSFGAKAFGRMWYARTNDHPYRLWGSDPGQPQYVPITNYRDTEDREPITGLAKSRDVLLVFCLNSLYILRKHGSSGFDFTLQKINSAVGCTSHWAIKEIHNKLFFPGTDGVWLYDGGLRYLMADIRNYYRDDYKANRDAFRDAFAIDDQEGKNYVLFTPRSGQPAFESEDAAGTVCYVGNYVNSEPSLGGGNAEPDWSLDVYNRLHTAALYSAIGDIIICSDDAEVRKFDLDEDEDDGDTLEKHMVIEHGHNLFMEPGDDCEGGKIFGPAYVHMESEYSDWTAAFFGGDEAAGRSLDRDNAGLWWKKDVDPSLGAGVITTDGTEYFAKFVAKSVHWMTPERCGGRGLTLKLDAILTRRISYRGFGGWHRPGAAQRGPEHMAELPGSDFGGSVQVDNGGWLTLPQSIGISLGYVWDLHGIITGTAVEPAWLMLEVEKPSGLMERLVLEVKEGDWTNPQYTPTLTATLELGDNTVTCYVLDSEGNIASPSGVLTLYDDT